MVFLTKSFDSIMKFDLICIEKTYLYLNYALYLPYHTTSSVFKNSLNNLYFTIMQINPSSTSINSREYRLEAEVIKYN